MKRFFTLSFFFFSFCLFGQNLIPDPSAEDFVECPSSFGNLNTWVPAWQSFRGSPDYFNSCSEGLGWNNDVGFQEPRTGEGYLGLLTFSRNLNNTREYFGVELSQPLIIGDTYYLTFHVSRSHKDNTFNLASNNIGALLMTENYLTASEQGPTLNFSTFNEQNLVVDTISWVEMSYQFLADSSYLYLAFGNFFDDEFTDTLRIGGEPAGEVTSYYYFDDFCLTTLPEGCDFINATIDQSAPDILLYPNPCLTELFIEHTRPIGEILIFSVQGELLERYSGNGNHKLRVDLALNPGIYFAIFESEGKKATKRFMVLN